MTNKLTYYLFRSLAGLFLGLCLILGQAQLIPNSDIALVRIQNGESFGDQGPAESAEPAISETVTVPAASSSSSTIGSAVPSSSGSQVSNNQATSENNDGTPSGGGDTAPESVSAFVAFYADNQSDTDAEDISHQRAVDYIVATGADPVFHAGDLMEDGTQNSLDRFNTVTGSLRASRAFYGALGNNDRKVGDASTPSPLYLANFSFPNNEQWYSVNVGNLHLVVLDSAFSSGSAAQLSWLQSDLASADSRDRITGVMYHHPSFTSTVASYLVDNGVDFAISGHIHSYSHTESSGVDYFTCSGQPTLGYLTAQIYSTKAIIRAYNDTNNITETVEVASR